MTASNTAIKFEMITGEIGRITLNQPDRRNALSAQMWDDLVAVLQRARKNLDLKVLIITGAGDHFSAGADISEFSTLYATPESSAEISKKISVALDALADFPKPTIAQISGACVGGGAGIAIACDIRFADNSGKLAVTPGKIGLVYPFADVNRLVQTVGLSNAKDILFSARLIKAPEAKSMGLIHEILKKTELEQYVKDYAQSICAISARSVQITKQMFKAISEGQCHETPETQQWFLEAFSSDDFKEGYTAFLEKRKPQF